MHNVVKDRDRAHILIAEDEPLIAWMLEDEVSAMGFKVVGPFPSAREACASIEELQPKAALLDVNLTDGEVFPLADKLRDRNIPLIFHTAHSQDGDIKNRYEGAQIITKPSAVHQIREAITSALGQLD